MTDLTIVRRSLTSRAFSTVITVLMVATAVGLMLVLLSMRDAGRRAFERGTGNMHMLVSRDASPLVSVLNGVFYANAPRNPIPWSKFQDLKSSLPLEYAIPTQLGDSYRGLPVMATAPELFSQYEPDPGAPWRFAEGRAFEAPFEVVVGAAAAEESGLSIGDEIFLTHGSGQSRGGSDDAASPHVHRDFGYEIVGVLEPTGGPHDRALFTDLESAWIIHAHDRRRRESPEITSTTAEDLIDADRLITGIYMRVFTRPGAMVSGAQQQIFNMLRSDTTITVADPSSEIQKLFRIVSNIDTIFVAMAAVVMVSSGIAILLAMYNSMEQRRRQIAVLRVLGCSRGRIFGLIVTESAIIGVIGAAAGILLTLVGMQIVSAAMKARLGLVIEPRLPLEPTLLVTVATIALASAAGMVPAVMGYRTAVVRNLRPLG